MSFMINPFIVAPAGGGGGGSLPSGATWHLDFINEFYYAGGAERAVADVLGVGFDPGFIDAEGIDTTGGNGNEPEAIGTLLADATTLFAAGTTIVIEIDGLIGGTFIAFIDNADPELASDVADVFRQGLNCGIEDWASMFANFGVPPATDQIHRLAFTFYRDIGGGNFESAISIDGAAAVTDTTAYGGTWFTPVTVGILTGWSISAFNNNWKGRTITGYPAKPSADLPALSAVAEPDPLEISGTPVLTTEEDTAYAGFTVSATGGTAPYTYSIQTGSLPTGITLNSSTGAVSGTPTTPGTSSGIVIRVTDDLGATDDLASFNLEVTVAGGLTPMIVDDAIYAQSADPIPDYMDTYTDNLLVPIKRITGVPGTQIGSFTGKLWGDIARPQYPKHSFWNCDGTVAYLEHNAGSGAYSGNIFLHGSTFVPIACWDRPSGWEEARWHETDPDLMVAVINETICYYDVTDGTVFDVLHDFTGTYEDMTIGLYEGELSWDGDIVPIQANRISDDHAVAFAYKISTDTVLGVIDLNGIEIIDGGVSISPLGTYMVRYNDNQTHDVHLVNGTHVINFPDDDKPSHYSFIVDAGIEYVVGGDRSAGGELIKRRLSNGATTVLGPDAFTYHTSCRSHDVDWVSTSFWPDSDSPNGIYVSEIDIVAYDGSVVGRVCHTHKSSYISYDWETQDVIRVDGKMIAFHTDWHVGSGGDIMTFVADFSTGFSCAGLFP